MQPEDGFDLIAVEARLTTPQLETACEVCLREVERGRRVGFIFLDLGVLNTNPLLDQMIRRHRLQRVRALERTLREHGVTVFPMPHQPQSPTPLTAQRIGIDSLDALRDYRMGDAMLGVGVLSSLITFLKDTAPDVNSNRVLIDRLMASAQQAFTLTSVLIEQYKPKCILVFNGRLAYSKGITEAARLAKVRLLYHESSVTHERYYLSEHSVHNQQHARESVLQTWNNAPEDRIFIGTSFFTRHRASFLPLHAPYLTAQQFGYTIPANNRRRIVYFASSVDEFAAVEDGLTPTVFQTQFEAVTWLVAWTQKRSDTELIIRMHPRMLYLSTQELMRWRSLCGDNVTLLEADSTVDSCALASTADRVLAFHSTMAIEATYLGIPSILVGDAAYRGLDCVYEPTTPGELETLLEKRSLLAKPMENCIPYGYWMVTQGEPYHYFQPTSYVTGRFLGKRLPAENHNPIPVRVGVSVKAALRRLRKAFKKL